MGSELHKKAVMMARISNMSLNQFVENAIKEAISEWVSEMKYNVGKVDWL